MSISSHVLSAVFSDETPSYRYPSEPDPWESVLIRLRTAKNSARRVQLLFGNLRFGALMVRRESDAYFDYYEAGLVCTKEEVIYRFLIDCEDGGRIAYDKSGARAVQGNRPEFNDAYAFRFKPGFHVPDWAKGAVQYQIFPDRFCNGDPTNDVTANEYYYTAGHVRHVDHWDAAPMDTDFRCFYGGDLPGVMEKLDYLQSIGVEVIYLNPIFLSPSSHKYDTQDYEHIDPHFGVIADDTEYEMREWEHHNGYAVRYLKRVLSKKNLRRSDALFAKLCGEMHRRGMKIILDGVFNHCGSFHRWMDREGVYLNKPGFKRGAYQDEKSPYRPYFRFTEEAPGYEAWWGVETLPKLCYEQSRSLCEEIFSVAEKWLRPPYSIDGWRLDVAADLGHSREFNHEFWREFRSRVKAVNPEALIIAEHYGDATDWLQGDQWDTVMNYDAFMEPLTFFLTGLEKHSDGSREELRNDGPAFFETMRLNMAHGSSSVVPSQAFSGMQ